MFTTNKSWILILLLLLLLTACTDNKKQPVVNITHSPANGLTEAAMDGDYLMRLEQETLDAANQRLTETYERNDVPLHARYSRARVKGRLIEAEGKRLAVIDLTYSESRVWVSRITGVINSTTHTVSCISPEGMPMDVLDPEGACGEAVKQTLLNRTQ
ncbi:MAG: hypothetical protein RPT95_11010 [Candidatus Sedimenticola sp. (ex Thyasira tokunagai)]